MRQINIMPEMRTRRGWAVSRGLLVQYTLMWTDSITSLRQMLDCKGKIFAIARDGTFMGLVIAVEKGESLDGQLVVDTGGEPIWIPINDPRLGSIIARETGVIEWPELEEAG